MFYNLTSVFADYWCLISVDNGCFRQSKESYVRMQKERDYHRMHYRRVTQEKNRLIADVKRYRYRGNT